MARRAFWKKKSRSVSTASAPPGAGLSPLVSRTASELGEEVSTYHVYHKGGFHHRLTPERDEYKDKVWPSWAETRQHMKEKREKKRQKKLHPSGETDDEMKKPGFFVHKPRVCFGHPPRTLRRGQSKQGPPLCLIHNSWFWRRWQIQFCDGLDDPGVVDPRGIVSAEHGYANKRDSIRRGGEKPNGFVQGYPVKKWRVWGDTGKEYHRSVNKRRDEGEKSAEDRGAPLQVSTAITLTWLSAFSSRTRQYHFRYQNLDFYWKGTGTVRRPGFWGFCTRFNHLKLVVRIPTTNGLDSNPEAKHGHTRLDGMSQTREVVLTTYASSPAARKAGTLKIRDDAILWLLKFYIPGQHELLGREKEFRGDLTGTALADIQSHPEQPAESQLHICVIATGMSMVIAEHQKREWLRHILALAAGEAGSASG